MSKLTIVIDNIHEDDLNEMWQDAIRSAKSNGGVPIKQKDTITLDWDLINNGYPTVAKEIIPPMLSGIFTCNLMCEADKILNK